MLLGHLFPQKGNTELHLTSACCMLYCVCHIPFEIWIANLKRRGFLEVTAIIGRIILKCILKK
jgi:hypothetical protein